MASVSDDSARVSVWMALSELYLDTDIDASLQTVAETLAASPYALDALYDILIDEVHPALIPNLLNVAGEWAGFDRDWLVERIRAVRARPRWRRRWSRLTFSMVREDWRRLEGMIRDLRATAPAA